MTESSGPSNLPPALTLRQVAEHCGVNVRTVQRWIEKGQMKAAPASGRPDPVVEVGPFLDFLGRYEMPMPEGMEAHRRRVLVVEDEPPIANLIERLLKKAGFETQVAMDGFRAGALLATWRPWVMTLDLRLPGLGGVEVVKFLKASPVFSNVRIVVVSAMPHRELDEAVAAGADVALEKPFSRESLLINVAKLAGIELPPMTGTKTRMRKAHNPPPTV